MVIEGVVTDQAGPDSVLVSKTGDYFTPALTFPQVSNAFVTIFDDRGNGDTLKEASSGLYYSSALQGVPGRTYTLKVTAEGKEYDALSTMPYKVMIDSLYATPLREFDGDRGFTVYVAFKDPPEQGNYYRIKPHVNSLPPDSIGGGRYLLYSDKLTNGNEAVYQIRLGRNVNAGDTVTVELLSLDKATYDYFNTLKDVLSSDRSPTSLSPANPTTNLSNGSLGYFAAFAIDSKRIILK